MLVVVVGLVWSLFSIGFMSWVMCCVRLIGSCMFVWIVFLCVNLSVRVWLWCGYWWMLVCWLYRLIVCVWIGCGWIMFVLLWFVWWSWCCSRVIGLV